MNGRRSPARLLLVLVVGGALAVAGPVQAQDVLDADAWIARLRSAHELAELRDAPPSPARMADVRAALGMPVEVRVRGWIVELPADPVLGSLPGDDVADFGRARTRLTLLEQSIRAAVAREVPAEEQLAEALRRAHSSVLPARPDPVTAMLQAIGEVIGAVLRPLGSLIGGGSGLGWLLLVGLAAASTILVLQRVRLLPDRTLAGGDSRRAVGGSVDWTRRADEAARAGDLREAVRALYLALLANLTGRGLLVDAPALTAGEVRAAVARSRPVLGPAVERATQAYERVVYGGDDAEREDVDELRKAAALARSS